MFRRRSELEKFLAVAEAGKIVAAADRLAVTQPALTRAIARIESRFGAPLFERLPTGVRPTALGAVTAEQARRILRAFEEAEDRIGGTLAGRTLAGRTGCIRATADCAVDAGDRAGSGRALPGGFSRGRAAAAPCWKTGDSDFALRRHRHKRGVWRTV